MRGLREFCRQARRDRRGIAAVEFALVLPVGLVLLYGEYAVGEAVAISRKVTITARTVTDLVTQNSSLTSASLTTILNASAQVVAPFSVTPMTIVITEITTDSSGKATVTWSKALNGTPLNAGDPITVPANLMPASTSLIWGQVSYNYTPLIGANLTGTIRIADQIYLSPRLTASIPLAN